MKALIKIGRLRWLGQLYRMQELDPCRQLTVIIAEGTRLVGKPKLSWWFESVEEILNKMGWREELETEVAGSRTMEGKFCLALCLQNLWFISAKKVANFVSVVGVFLPRKFKLISGIFELISQRK